MIQQNLLFLQQLAEVPGVSFSLIAVKYISTGVASTLMAIVPILIIPPAVLFFKQKVSFLEIIGAFISVGGVTLFFI